jgi:RNA polymerase sigma-70 factor (ECF subfamily)
MERIRRNEARALGELMDIYWADLVRYCASLTGSPDEGEDVTQRVFIQVWQARAEWSAAGTVAGYMFRVARNLSINRVRQANVRKKSEPEIARRWRAPPSPLESAALSEFEAALEQALGELGERRRLAFRLVRFQGLSLDDAGAVMGVSRRTVANHLYLASEQLYERLRPFLT